MAERYFSPESVFWRVNRELLVMLGGLRALLLQLAHPLVAEGVAEHSDFRNRPLQRGLHTVQLLLALAFDEPSGVRRVVRRTQHCHAPVHGRLRTAVGDYPAGTEYDANETSLQRWVIATLIDSALAGYELLVTPLSAAEKQAYYADSLTASQAFGLAASDLPADYPAFHNYVSGMLAGSELVVGEPAREAAAALLAPPGLGPLVRWGSLASLGLLPEPLRVAYGLAWTPRHGRALARLAAVSRRLRPFCPAVVCVHPKALLAERNIRKASTSPFKPKLDW